MVLDWSKVNSFQSDWRSVHGQGRYARLGAKDRPVAASMNQPQLLPNLYSNVDLAALVEEVVEGAVVGHAFQHLPSVDFTNLNPSLHGSRKGRRASKTPDSVEVILDISTSQDKWLYVTQPGAFRRCG